MTKKKALEIFKFMLKSGKGTIDYWDGTIAEQRAAIEIAIKALKQQPSDDCISRKAVIDLINADWKYEGLELSINELPPVTPTHGTCMDCKHFHNVRKDFNICDLWTIACTDNHYCADFEKRGNENE